MSTLSASPPARPPAKTDRKKATLPRLLGKKTAGEPIAMLTAYDYPTSQALDAAGVDILLVGDSLAMVVLGHPNTLSVTVDEMLHHCRAVSRGARFALLVGDMPFMSYQVSVKEAVRNAGRFLKEAGMEAVKLEGGRLRLETVRAIVAAGIPVMGHLGLLPQSVHQLGGFRAQGRDADTAVELARDARLLQEAGCFSIVLESVPARLAKWISKSLEIPTIGIGAGVGCDGQVLVSHDLLGLFDRFTPRFVKTYADLHGETLRACEEYVANVRQRSFPSEDHSVEMPDEEWAAFLGAIESG